MCIRTTIDPVASPSTRVKFMAQLGRFLEASCNPQTTIREVVGNGILRRDSLFGGGFCVGVWGLAGCVRWDASRGMEENSPSALCLACALGCVPRPARWNHVLWHELKADQLPVEKTRRFSSSGVSSGSG